MFEAHTHKILEIPVLSEHPNYIETTLGNDASLEMERSSRSNTTIPISLHFQKNPKKAHTHNANTLINSFYPMFYITDTIFSHFKLLLMDGIDIYIYIMFN